jgi:hypothetical protein
MKFYLNDLWDGQAERIGEAARRAPRCALRVLAAYKRASAWTPLVSMPMTSAHPRGARWAQPCALSQVTIVEGPSVGRDPDAGRS